MRSDDEPARRARVVYVGMWVLFGPVLVLSGTALVAFVFVCFMEFRPLFLAGASFSLLMVLASGFVLHSTSMGRRRCSSDTEPRGQTGGPSRGASSDGAELIPGPLRAIGRRVRGMVLAHPISSVCVPLAVAGVFAFIWTVYVSGHVLRVSAEKGEVGTVRFLLALGADPNRADEIGITPLHCAAGGGSVEVVKALLDAGADVSARVADPILTFLGRTQIYDGYTPLHFAAERGHVAVIELLVASGADVNVGNAHGYTPLHEAVRGPPLALFYHGSADAVRALLALGADPNIRTRPDRTGDLGVTALDLVDHAFQSEIGEILRVAMGGHEAGRSPESSASHE